MHNRTVNLARTKTWSFAIFGRIRSSGSVFVENENVYISGKVKNDGLKVGTVYVRVLVADSYDHRRINFDSDKDLSGDEKHHLRLVDIAVGKTRSFTCHFVIPPGNADKHFDIRAEVWNPHFLTKGPHPYCFDATDWDGGFQVLARDDKRPKVFVSYSWDSEKHKRWVRQLVEELRKFGVECAFDQRDALAGDELTLLLEEWITKSKVLILVCTENYTNKANARKPGGVGLETVISSSKHAHCSAAARSKFIPIVRDNKRGRLPTYLAGC